MRDKTVLAAAVVEAVSRERVLTLAFDAAATRAGVLRVASASSEAAGGAGAIQSGSAMLKRYGIVLAPQ
jgi:hypothetical protein